VYNIRNLNTVGPGSFAGVTRPGRGVDYPTSSSVEFKERVELYLYFRSGSLACSLVNFTCTFTFTFTFIYAIYNCGRGPLFGDLCFKDLVEKLCA
jgi:hypothetical protein